jgi:hypothetical protein
MSSKQLVNSADTRVVYRAWRCGLLEKPCDIVLPLARRIAWNRRHHSSHRRPLFDDLLAPGDNEILAVLTWRSLSGIADDRKKVVEVHSIIFIG